MTTPGIPEMDRPDGGAGGAGRPSGSIRISLFGGFGLEEDGEYREIPRAIARLLALLALHREGLSRNEAAALLLPHLDPRPAATRLRGTLARLRATGLDVVEEEGVLLRLAPGVRVDAWELEELVAALPAAPVLDHHALPVSDLLDGWNDLWVIFPRERMRDLAMGALEEEARRATASGDLDRAWRAALAAAHIDPLRDSYARAVIEIHLAEGNGVSALRAYHLHYRILKDLGAEPSEATTALIAPMIGSVYWERLERGWRSPRERRRRQ